MIFNEELNYERAREVKDTLESLFQHYGWQLLTEALEQRSILRERELVQMCPATIEQMVSFARIKGSIDELRLIAPMLQAMLTDVTLFIQQAQEEAEDGESNFEPQGEI